MASLLPEAISSRLAKRKERKALDFISQNLNPAGRRFLNLFGGKISNLLAKDDRSIVREAVTRYSDLIEPPYDPYELQNLYETHWTVRMCVDKLVRESTRQGWKFEPLYEVKCDSCGTEYDYQPLSGKCPACVPPQHPNPFQSQSTMASSFAKAYPPAGGAMSTASNVTTLSSFGMDSSFGNLSPPDRSELERAQEFLANPNKDGLTCDDIIKRAVKDLLIFDDFYTSIWLRKDIPGPYYKRLQLSPEDARMIAIQADVKGRLGGKTFCQVCEATKTPGSQTFLYAQEDAGKKCPSCGRGTLTEMAYAQRKGNSPVAAWSKDEIVHGNLWAIGSKLFGTPKLWSIQTQVVAMALIDKFQKDTFDKAKTPKNIFLVRGVTNESLRAAQRQFEQAKLIDPMADMWIAAPNAPGMAGGSQIGIEKIPSLDPPIIENSIPYQEFTFKNICYTFGVSPSAIGAETPGRLGTGTPGTEQRDVTPETINEIQKQVGETFDQFLKKFFPEIVSWSFALETAHEDEETRQAALKKLQMEYAKIAVDAGFDVIIDEDGKPKVSGSGKQPQPAPNPFAPKQPGENPFGGVNENRQHNIGSQSTAIAKSHSVETVDLAIAKFTPPNGIGAVGAKVYSECRSRWVAAHPDDTENQANKTMCAKIAWTAQNNASKSVYTPDEIEKASRFQTTITQAAKEYKGRLDLFAQSIFSRLRGDLENVLGANTPDNRVTPDLKVTLLDRAKRILDPVLQEAETLALDASTHLYNLGQAAAGADMSRIAKQEPPSSDALEASKKKTIEAMRNVLYFGDKDSYLQKISDIMDQGINENWTTDQLARELQKQLDPEQEHFSSYMWERIARTESATYVIQGRIDAYTDFGIPLLKRIETLDDRTDQVLCAPYAGVIYRIEDSDNVIPAHPNCRGAWAPYFGDPAEAIDSLDVIHNL